ncbi:MAG: heat-inducible transcriptional repressor HrcA [Acidobacteriota bacterium]
MAKKQSKPELNERARNILKAIVREYVRTGKPVGSRRLAKIYREGVSAATIRNVVSDLEELGFVAQPHTSAGRVPTPLGYRFYVDSLTQTRELAGEQAKKIKQSLEQEPDPGELMSKASQLLSALSNNLGFVITGPVSLALMKHVEFVKISEQRILAILVTTTGFVQHRIVHVDENLSQSDLDQAGRYLVEHFRGKTLVQMRDELINLMMEEKALYDRMLKNVVLLGSASLMNNDGDNNQESEVYFGGTAQIIQKAGVVDINRMIVLFQTFEEKSRLVKIITECIREDQLGPTVTIGLEKHIPGMRDWALISSPYLHDQRIMGSLGVMGPARMEYEKAISLVDYVAKLFGKILSSN